jgi:fructokinase
MRPHAGMVVVAGEALIDLVPRPDGALAPIVGGGPFNTARALGRLGQPTAFVGSVSEDALGREIAAALTADGIWLDDSLRTERPTSLAVAQLDAEGRATYRFYFEETSAPALTPVTALASLPDAACALHVGGLGLVLQPMAEAIETLCGRLAGDALVMVDPNVRPTMIQDPASYEARVWRVVSKADIVKVSDEDLRALVPELAPRDAARALLGRGPKLVLLTLGAEGAVAFGTFGSHVVAAPRVTVVDTIGAGDIFSGAWLARWLERGAALDDGEAVQDATRFACRAAALSCARQGASPPTRAEMTEEVA